MNIFVLDTDPKKAAKYHGDKHVVKMITESCQMMSTCLQVKYGINDKVLYKVTHENHPCNVWLRESDGNLLWLLQLTIGLLEQYDIRYSGEDTFLSARRIVKTVSYMFRRMVYVDPSQRRTPFAQAMPEQFKSKFAVDAYREYYLQDKIAKGIAVYNFTKLPYWAETIKQ